MSYRVTLDLFEGPLDLLLHLVKKNEVSIVDIPIASVTDQYLEYMALLEVMNLDVAGEFLVMAATLVYLKSRSLLPEPDVADEEVEEGDPRAELIARLLEYQRYREVAQALGERRLLHRDVFARPADAGLPDGGDEDGAAGEVREATLGALLDALRRVLRRTSAAPVHEVASEGLSVRDCFPWILESLRHVEHITFDALFPSGTSRHRVIVTFLALLELMRWRVIRVHQAEAFGTLEIVRSVSTADEAIAIVRAYEAGEWNPNALPAGGEG